MPVYDPEFINDEIAPLYARFGVTRDESPIVRFLTMLNAGFLLATTYCRNSVAEAAKTGQWKGALAKSGKIVLALEEGYSKETGDAGMKYLESYFEALRSKKIKCLRFSLADKPNACRKIRDETGCGFFSEPDALETGRYHFIPLIGEEPKGVGFSGILEPVITLAAPETFSRYLYPERKDPKELAKEAGDMLGLRQELFLVEAGG